MPDLHIVILAAGKGTRMKSRLPKVLHQAAGVSLIEHVLAHAAALNPASTTIIVGHQAELVKSVLARRPGVQFALQEPQLGTGHALLQAEPFLAGKTGTVVLLSGDVPLLRTATLEALVRHHLTRKSAATVLTAHVDAPDGYGRIVRTEGKLTAIVEHKDASRAERAIHEINSGIYAFELAALFENLRRIGSANAQGEYYLPDLVGIVQGQGQIVEAMPATDPREVLGVNSRQELAEISALLRTRRNAELMEAGVTVIDPATTWVGPDVTIGEDTILHPNVFLEGSTRVGSRCEINAGVRIIDSTLGDGVLVNNFCVIRQSTIESGAEIGPFAQLRPLSHVEEQAHVGNFVELKKTRLGRGSKANHLTYLGDATIGEKVNVGAGTITCNYDGVAKHPTVIEDGAFIGSDTQLIAPVRVGKGAYVAAGSSITEDVPAEALAIGRGKQVNKPGWVRERKPRKAT
jgi:bifunctional UDP-N-acetylglucosamine pyrophosphorylase/glucosamine-1-phosphate N-acetyltransferase